VISPAEQLVHRRDLARHEAAHCAAMVAAGVVPEKVHVTVNANEARGAVTLNRADFSGVKMLMAVLAGILALGEPPPRWPLVRGKSADEDRIADLVDHLGAGREGYAAAVRATRHVIAGKPHVQLEDALAFALEHCAPVIDQAGIERIADIVARHYDEED
jgi:hypothetical protein